MAEQNRATLKNYFQTGDRPSQAQYADLIDSQLNLAETGIQTMAGALSSSGIECTGDITTTANISASGTVHTTNLTVTSLGSTQVPFIQAGSGGDFEGSGLFTFLGGTLSVPNITQVTTTNIETTGNGHISASGNISSSNKVSGLTGSFGFFEASTSSFGLFESTLISSSNIITHHITASSDISASGNIQALTGSFTNYQGPLLSVTPEQQSIGDAIEQGTATFIKLRQSLGRMDVNCLNGTEKKIVFSTKNLIIDDENSTTTQRTLIKGSITASSDISSSGNITGKTGSFSHIEGNSPLNINLSLGHIQGISRLDFENANLFGNPIFHGDVNIYSQSFLLDSNDSTILRSNDVVGTGGLIEFGDEVNARTRIQGLNVELRGPVTMSSTISSSGTVFANNAQFGSSTVFINGPEGQITASGDISASGTISALTASIAHFIPSNTPAQNNLGNVLDFTFSGSALFTTIPDHVMAAIGQPQQRVEIAAGSITASSGIIASYFHTPHGKVGINTGLFTPTTPSDPDLKVVGTGGGAGAPPAVEVVGDISASGKITGLTGSFGRLEGLSPITFGDDVIINGNLTASNNGAHLGALLVGTGGYDIDETVTIHSESGAYFLEYDPTGVADGAAYIYKSPPAGTIGVNNEHDGSVNGHIGLFLNNASFRIANSGGQLGNSINEASMSFAQSASISAIRFQNLPTSKEQAAQIGTGSLWLSGSADDGTSKFLLVYTG